MIQSFFFSVPRCVFFKPCAALETCSQTYYGLHPYVECNLLILPTRLKVSLHQPHDATKSDRREGRGRLMENSRPSLATTSQSIQVMPHNYFRA